MLPNVTNDLAIGLRTPIDDAEAIKTHRGAALAELTAGEDPIAVPSVGDQPPRGQGTVRTISIENTDYQPCGGTHVRNTAEIGELLITSLKSKGKQNKRISLTLVQP